MKFKILSVLLLLLFSCKPSEFDVLKNKIIRQADACMVYYYENGNRNSIIASAEMEREEMYVFLDSIFEKNSGRIKCGYTGSVQFFRNNEPLFDDVLKFNTECLYINLPIWPDTQSHYFSIEGHDLLLRLLETQNTGRQQE